MNPPLRSDLQTAVLNCMRESYALLDARGITVTIGPRDEDLLGRRGADAVGESAFAHVHPDELPAVLATFETLLREPGGRQGLDVRCRHADGTWRWLRAEGTNLLHNPGVGFVVATFSDVTCEHEASAALRARTALAERVVQHLNFGVWVRRLPGFEIVFVSDGVGRIWGRRSLDVVESPQSLLATIHPDDRAAMAARIGGRPAVEDAVQFRILRPDGAERRIVGRRLVLDDPSGETFIAGVLVDITEDWQVLQAAARAERLAAQNRLSLRLAHDFGNFVAAIQASAETLAGVTSPFEVRDEADLILSSCLRAGDLVKRLLQAGRNSSGAPKEVQLTQEVAEAMTLLRRCAGPGVSLTLDCSVAELRVRIDPLELHQVLLHLVANASHAMGGRGGIVIGTAEEPDRALLWVADEGPGIPPDQRERVFEPFATTRGGEGGNGLGLPAVRAIVEGSGGRVELAASGERGARFEIRLPRLAVAS